MGFLYRSNKLMYDQRSNSLWNQFTGKPVVGKFVGSGIELKILASGHDDLGPMAGTASGLEGTDRGPPVLTATTPRTALTATILPAPN